MCLASASHKIWITAYIYLFLLLLCFAFVDQSSGLGNALTNDVDKIPILKGNIPRDYIIKVKYVPKSSGLSDACWLILNLHKLQESLENLAEKFDHNADNRNNITVLINMVQQMRSPYNDLERDIIGDLDCLYVDGYFNTSTYFKHFTTITKVYEVTKYEDDEYCNPPCTAESISTETGSITSVSELTVKMNTTPCISTSGCTTADPKRASKIFDDVLPQKVQISFLSLLLIPLIAFVLVWQGRKRKRRERSEEEKNANQVTEHTDILIPENNVTQEERDRLRTEV
ncbi:kit ligand a isoform X6 [Erpetoichthys calabaricus]|uniref:Kit ligand n=1 Tax=Erpetoichthys calabaricus TaxID=27687 RepID=A0A8C4SFV1_ERPCA|nr:kit ligand a isoform X3 [Erpetoichthys calabaricus]XP_051787432.1 kit ligand a isoform X4 [Erpetoichthys calabaricus]XP_051787437.1 kit ligand a isoform X5 [Erpetoichthys calabaricus]XP_051787438.1 kit ligand a isoform X6 [Erpetoichthys calabaricus]